MPGGALVSGTQAVDRAVSLLATVVQSDDPVSFSALAESSGLARSTTSRLLTALERGALLERDSTGSLIAGPLFALYALRHDPGGDISRLAGPMLQHVARETGETVHLGVPRGGPRGGTVLQVGQVDSRYVLGTRDWSAVDVPSHCSAQGQILYAYGALDLPVGTLETPTPRSVRTLAQLQRVLAEVRARGYAVTRDELELGLSAVAAPVSWTDGAVVAALGVSGPTSRVAAEADDIGRLLVESAESLSRLLRRRTLCDDSTEGAA